LKDISYASHFESDFEKFVIKLLKEQDFTNLSSKPVEGKILTEM